MFNQHSREAYALTRALTSLLPWPMQATPADLVRNAPPPLLQALRASTWSEEQALQSQGLGLPA